MTDECKWELQGSLSQITYKTNSRGNGYWVLLVRITTGDLCIYVHDVELQRKAESLSLGQRVSITGKVDPHANFKIVEKPYFLNPLSIDVIQPS